MHKLRMAVVGAGYLGSIHTQLALAQPDVELVAVVDPSPDARRRMESLGVPAVDHVDECIGHLDAAIVACPTRYHFAVARRLLEADVHLFIEKPLTATVAEADELIQLADQRHLIVQVGHVERFNPALAAARPLLSDICYIQATRTSGHACRSTDIGAVLDLMIHDLDLVLDLIESPLVELHASGTVVIGPYEDTAEARLEFANGAVANLMASRVSRHTCRQMRLVTRQGVIELDFADRQCWWERPAEDRLAEFQPDRWSIQEREEARRRFFDEYLPRIRVPVPECNALYEEQRDFLLSVRTGRPPKVTAQAARQTLAVAEAIQQEIVRFTQRTRMRPRPHIPGTTADGQPLAQRRLAG